MATQPIFHRGYVLGGREENTLPAIREASQRGFGCEFDLRPTQDDKVIAFHDPTWGRMTSYSGDVLNTTFDEATSRKTNGGSDIPGLGEALAAASEGPVLLDIKKDDWTEEALLWVGERLTVQNAWGRCWAFSDYPTFINRLNNKLPRLKTVWRTEERDYSVAKAKGMGVSGILVTEESLTRTRVDNFQEAGIRVFIQSYSIDNKAQFDRTRNLNANGMIIDAEKWQQWT